MEKWNLNTQCFAQKQLQPYEKEEYHDKNKNIQKQTLESDDFYHLVKNKIDKNRGKIKLINQ